MEREKVREKPRVHFEVNYLKMKRIKVLVLTMLLLCSYTLCVFASDSAAETTAPEVPASTEETNTPVAPEGWDGEEGDPADFTPVQVYDEPSEIVPYATKSGTWQKKDGKYWYKYDDGTYPASTWEYIDGQWYYFDASGWMVTGWNQIKGTWYYFYNTGNMATGWLQLSGKWYYLESNGAMVTGWHQIGGSWYYFNTSGVMQTGWLSINGKSYYCNSDGVMLTGKQQIGSKYYVFDSSGVKLHRYTPDYSCSKAISYANRYASKANTSGMFPDWTGDGKDCTNYVSQCLLAGGLLTDGTWNIAWGTPVKTNAWASADGLKNYLKDNELATKLSSWSKNADTDFITNKYVNNSNQLTSSNTGKVVIFYDWNWKDGGGMDHAAFFVRDNTKTYNTSLDGNVTGDLINQHSPERDHVIWHGDKRNTRRSTTTIYAFEINT